MQTFLGNMAARLVNLLAALVLAFAQGGAQAQPAPVHSQRELDRMLAPIALYPDALLAQILVAATYPMEVAEAARWAAEHPDLSGDAAVRAVEFESWGPSVKSLVAFPQLLARMAENPQWTQALGDAFLEQQARVMDTVQALRHRAQAAGGLRSEHRVSVVESGPSLLVQSVDPRVVHVPYYDPQIVYGSWWWPGDPPMHLRPWPGYYARPAYAGGFYWGPPIVISAGFPFGAIDWGRRQIRVVQVNNTYRNHPKTVHQPPLRPRVSVNPPRGGQHDPDRRRGLTYRNADARPRFEAARAPAASNASRIEARRPELRFRAQTGLPPAPVAAPVRRVTGTRFEPSPPPRAIGAAAQAHGGRALGAETRRAPGTRSAHPRETRFHTERRARP